ncbi:unnamed protein product [Adineta ricciae]|uniref:Dynein regulatory complex subunit 7 n=1 Tax=Adineta ricciae TaxID=249248 RepID=A0A814LDW5_ADIRI|nr:unnamed protein product [Adineta ricciae]CAF1277866.1 unnamed protein product [Adineta ricciae]
MTDHTVSEHLTKTDGHELHAEHEQDGENALDANEEATDQPIDGENGQQEDNSPPKVQLQPIIAPDMFPPPVVVCDHPENYPVSYRSNSKKEQLILTFIENFRRQYHHLYRDRKPLFLNPYNECGVQKFVCTTVQPTLLSFSTLFQWDAAAEFVADHLNYELLEPPHEIPKTLWSPTKILLDQRGNCFDYATLLCSLLIGAGYDAYVVSGYATREVCYMDTTRLPNPYMKKKEEKRPEKVKPPYKKYTVKPPKDLTSKYDAYMHQRKLNEIQAEKDRKQEEENRRIAEIEKPLPDPLYGIRVHAWVLVLSGKREVPEAFFIEPTTGYGKATNDVEYLGIESVWNHQNYWVNVQDCSNGCESLQFDLNDQARWEFMFTYSANLRGTLTATLNTVGNSAILDEEDEKPSTEATQKDIELPPSWVDHLVLTKKEFQERYPHCRKTYFYKKTRVEKYAPYHMKDGIILKVSEFADYDFKDLIYVTQKYAHRQDKLEERRHDVRSNIVYENYLPGRSDHLKEHTYGFGPEFERIMIYYDKARIDGLAKRHETTLELTDYFVNRDDFLEYRKAMFEPRPKKFGPADKDTNRPILSITEQYGRNLELNANDDVREIVYGIKDEKFVITYHRDDIHITPSTRTFIKPPNWNDKTVTLKWSDDQLETYQADEDFKQLSKRDLYHKMLQLLEQEEEVIRRVRKAEDETRDLQNRRQQEELLSDLEVSVYDTDRNNKAKQYREALEKKAKEENDKKKIPEINYLAPFLAAIGNPSRINAQIANQLRTAAIRDFKERSIRKANLMQARYESEIQELFTKQQWYQKHQIGMTKEDELEYQRLCQEAQFRLHILEERLERHRQLTTEKYMQLENKLQEDSRLKEPYIIPTEKKNS